MRVELATRGTPLLARTLTHILRGCGVLVLIGAGLSTSRARVLAQTGVDVRLDVDSLARVRTEVLAISAAEELTVELVAGTVTGTPNVAVYVHDETGTLMIRDDPDATSAAFTWRPSDSGRYYVVLDNTGTGRATVRVRTTGARGPIQQTGSSDRADVEVFYATNRRQLAVAPRPTFGVDPTETSYGQAIVHMPREHRMGELEGPSILRLAIGFDPNPEKHVVLKSVTPEPENQFFKDVLDRFTHSRRREALLYVHGYNVNFEDALRRAAQIKYDLGFAGPALAFSWPSEGSMSPLAYMRDQRNADVSAAALKTFLNQLASSGVSTVHVVAHSMGNRVLTAALQDNTPAGSSNRRGSRLFGEMAMVAPDVDAELFKRAIKQIEGSATRVTLYASSRDIALAAAQRVAGYPRAGQAGPGILVLPGMETIDASAVETDILGLRHSVLRRQSKRPFGPLQFDARPAGPGSLWARR